MKVGMIPIITLLIIGICAGCGINETIEKIGARDSLPFMMWMDDQPQNKVRADLMDATQIAEIEDFFAQIDWEEDRRESWETPQYQVGNYQVWMSDQASTFEVVDRKHEKMAKLSIEESEFILSKIVLMFH